MRLTQIISAIGHIVSDPHIRMTVVLGVFASFATVIQNLSVIFEFQSLKSRVKEEKDRITEGTELLAALQSLGTKEASAACKQLEEDISLSLCRFTRLTEASREAREDPNHDLSFLQRLFILFTPQGQRAVVVHVLGYAFMAMVTMLVLVHKQLISVPGPEGYADLIVFFRLLRAGISLMGPGRKKVAAWV